MGINSNYLADLTKHLKGISGPESGPKISIEDSSEFYKKRAIKWMLQKIQIAPRWQLLEGSTSFHAFVGPCGAGKTSLIAKLAANYSARENAKVLIVSLDNVRLAATEQLRLYSNIIGVPFISLSSINELENKMVDYPEIDLVLIDTAGESANTNDQIRELNVLNSQTLPIDTHLVLPITNKEAQLEQCIRSFSSASIKSLSFSRLDESWTFGEIFNLSTKWNLPLSFFSTGQQVPDDLERASKERVIERIFGL